MRETTWLVREGRLAGPRADEIASAEQQDKRVEAVWDRYSDRGSIPLASIEATRRARLCPAGRVVSSSCSPVVRHSANAPQPVKKVLIVDDEDDIREVAQLSLEMMAGWEVVCARSGQEALEAAVRERPDAILLDVMMPGMDGPTTVRHLQEQPATREIPVILLTAKVQSAGDRQFSTLGVAGVISKPFDPLTLAELITQTLQGRPAS